jgi:hypothetical protein
MTAPAPIVPFASADLPAQTATPVAAATPPVTAGPVGLAAACTIVEAALLGLIMTGKIGAWLFLVGHLAVIGGLAAFTRRVAMAADQDGSAANTTPAVVLALAVAATGPIGALGGLIMMLLPRRPAEQAPLLQAWYDRIALSANVDQISRLCDDVSSGRHVGLNSPAPTSFVAVLDRGSLAKRQAALGLMARHIHPEYLPALKAALQSSEPVIRVQAAAVATKIRPELRKLVDTGVGNLAAGKVAPADALAVAVNLQSCVDSGLLDASDRIRADVTIARLKALADTVPLPTIGVSAAQETVLLQQGRFREMRVARRVAAAAGPLGRVRKRVPRPAGMAPDNATSNRTSLQETARSSPSAQGGTS